MGEGIEILLWLGIMAVVALRSAAQNRQKAERQKQAGLPDLLDDDLESTGADLEPTAAATTTLPQPAERRPLPTRDRDRRARNEDGGEKKGGLLAKWAEMAAELERQVQEQQRAAEEAQAAARREHEARTRRDATPDEPERLVVVPGRRVYPARTDDRSGPMPVRWEEPASARVAGAPSRLEARPHAEPVGSGTGRGRPRGLDSLERYGSLKRAMILSEVLGEPPGLSGVAPAERRLGGLD